MHISSGRPNVRVRFGVRPNLRCSVAEHRTLDFRCFSLQNHNFKIQTLRFILFLDENSMARVHENEVTHFSFNYIAWFNCFWGEKYFFPINQPIFYDKGSVRYSVRCSGNFDVRVRVRLGSANWQFGRSLTINIFTHPGMDIKQKYEHEVAWIFFISRKSFC